MNMLNVSQLSICRRWVIKFGSSILTNKGRGLDYDFINAWVKTMLFLKQHNIEVIIVSSGAIAAGLAELNIKQRPDSLAELQAAAAVGQTCLMQGYASAFAQQGTKCGQVLLTQEDLSQRQRYLNARTTLKELLSKNIVPIINENDTVAVEEICFGDNDTLASLVCNAVEADLMLILTDQNGIYDMDPRGSKTATLIAQIAVNDQRLDTMAGKGSELGRGGMISKVLAARIAARSGTQTLIANGHNYDVVEQILNAKPTGTWLYSSDQRLSAKKRWLGAGLKSKGKLTLDAGASDKVLKGSASVLPIGVAAVTGQFSRGDLLSVCNLDGRVIARGLSNYSNTEIAKLLGQHSRDITCILGYSHTEEVIHCDNLLLTP